MLPIAAHIVRQEMERQFAPRPEVAHPARRTRRVTARGATARSYVVSARRLARTLSRHSGPAAAPPSQ